MDLGVSHARSPIRDSGRAVSPRGGREDQHRAACARHYAPPAPAPARASRHPAQPPPEGHASAGPTSGTATVPCRSTGLLESASACLPLAGWGESQSAFTSSRHSFVSHNVR